tara:strand:+ start:31057 stop:31620 length:564 start_codon:yes stop_codon:yes gene_type:complete
MKLNYKYYIIFFLLLYLYTIPRYIYYLPTIPFYNNDEANIVFEKRQNATIKDIEFFKLTDPSIIFAFVDHVDESNDELRNIITAPHVLSIILFFKYIINRPRPYQIIKKIKPLYSETGSTPALPAGHAFQAYYLAHILSKRYPDKKQLFDSIAKRCDSVRVIGGIHYPSDGELSKNLVNFMINIGIF